MSFPYFLQNHVFFQHVVFEQQTSSNNLDFLDTIVHAWDYIQVNMLYSNANNLEKSSFTFKTMSEYHDIRVLHLNLKEKSLLIMYQCKPPIFICSKVMVKPW